LGHLAAGLENYVGRRSVKMDQFGGAIGGAGGTAATNGRGAGTAALRKGRDGGMEDQEALDLAADWADISQG
jgi:chromosomal replication initiator protein